MPVRIRLKRVGAKGQPYYRIVISDGRAPRDGREIEAIGHYNPLPAEPEITVDPERALLWLERGALASEAVTSLLAKQGVMERFYEKWPKRRPKPKAKAKAPAAPQAAAEGEAAPQGAEAESAG
jgi:small subunit ribosomal protein S16